MTENATRGSLRATDRSRVRRHPERASFDRATVHAILDESLVCHVGIVRHGTPAVIPMGFGRRGDDLILHGSPGSGLMKALAAGEPVCVTVTLLDGLVMARSAFHSSMNYRSVMVFGRCRTVDDVAEKRAALNALTDHLLPGRSREARPMSDQELAGTLVLALPIEEASAKVRVGPPSEPEEDASFPVWAGVVPLALTRGEPIPVPDLEPGLKAPRA